MNYLTLKLERDIKKGGIIIAPRRSGKTTAILNILKSSNEYVLVCHSLTQAEILHKELSEISKKSTIEIKKCIIGPSQIWKGECRKIIIDEFFWNRAFYTLKDYHCIISSNPRDMVVYNSKGIRLKINKDEMLKKGITCVIKKSLYLFQIQNMKEVILIISRLIRDIKKLLYI